MRVSNESEGTPSGPFAEFLRLQTDFQARLADETLRYLRRLQGTIGPATPGTVAFPVDGLEVAGEAAPGGTLALALEIENLQRVHCVVTPQLTPFVAPNGTTWLPTIRDGSGSRLVPPGAVLTLALTLEVPEALPPATYRAALLLQGFRDGAIAVRAVIESPEPAAPPPQKKRSTRRRA